MLVYKVGALLGWIVSTVVAIPVCPLDGPVFTKPLRPSENEDIKAAVATLNEQFANITAGAQNYSLSIQVYSVHEPAPIWELYHTAPTLPSNTTGVKTVDENTVFRLGSLTKIFTIYAWLVNAGDTLWNDPITKYVPELRELTNRSDPVDFTAWEDVTLGGLATQLTGIPREYALLGELTQSADTKDQIAQLGFPPLTEDETPPCGVKPTCSREQFFRGIGRFHPSLAPYQTPAYSNVAFQLLGYALETITGKPFQAIMEESVLGPLGLTNTFVRAPNDSLGVIPGDRYKTTWAFDIGESAPTGNMYTSVKDLSNAGRAILGNKLLSPVMTRRWLKPFAFSSDPKAMVGMPWGARRIQIEDTYRWTTAFNKAGSIGDYSALMAILPDFDIGISILSAGDIPGNLDFSLTDIIGDQIVPAIEKAARAEAGAVYSGHYAAANEGVNSSMTITTDELPGLSISQWFSNGTDFAWAATVLQVGYLPVTPRVRLYPSGLEGPPAAGASGKRVGFKVMFEDADGVRRDDKMFSTECGSWVTVESVIYGSVSVDELVFNLDV